MAERNTITIFTSSMSFRHLLKTASISIAVVLASLISSPASGEGRGHSHPDGSVGLSGLIALALQNDPGLVALRQNIPVEEARTRAAAQWRDPEVRVGTAKDDIFHADDGNPRIKASRPPSGTAGNPAPPVFREKSTSFRVRFFIPKPGEMKALVDQAARQADMAKYRVTAAEREVILAVRQQYEELQFLARKLEASRRQIAIVEQHVAREQNLLDSGGAFTLDQLSFEDIKIPGMKLAVDAAETELNAAKSALAARVGLSDGSRVRVSDSLVRSGIEFQDTDLDYLTLMAFAHRGEVGILLHEQAIAEAELGALKTQRIPWFSFVETDYSRDLTGGTLDDEAYGIRVGVILPLFSWLAKDQKVVEARIAGYYESLEANQKNIANEVAEAFKSVKEANRYRARTRLAIDRHTATLREKAEALEGSEDLAARERLQYDIEMEQYKFLEHSLAADRLFNQSLIRLERALGADLDRVLKVEFESLDGPAIHSYIVPSASEPVPSESPTMVRGKPIPAATARPVQPETKEPKRRGIFRFRRER